MKYLKIAALVLPLLFACSKTYIGNLEGIWKTQIELPFQKIEFFFEMRPSSTGSVKAFIQVPDISNKKYKPDIFEINTNEISFLSSSLRLEFIGKYIPQKDVLSGSIYLNGQEYKTEFVRADKISENIKPQTPTPPFEYNIEEVSIMGIDSSHTLSGTLTYPKGAVNAPGIVLVQGVGGHDRDYYIMGHKPFMVLADYFTKSGFVVLRYDERGIGKSTGNPAECTTYDFSRDALMSLRYLKQRKECDSLNSGIIGHSEGGTIASLVAENKECSFIIMLASPALDGYEYNIQFEQSIALSQGKSEQEINDHISFQKSILDIILDDNITNSDEKIRELYRNNYPDIPEDRIDRALERFNSPWFRYNLAHKPQEVIENVDCPIYAIYGEQDSHVPPEGNYEKMSELLKNSKQSKAEIIPGVNHFFQTATTSSPNEYSKIEETFSPLVMDKMNNWLSKVID